MRGSDVMSDSVEVWTRAYVWTFDRGCVLVSLGGGGGGGGGLGTVVPWFYSRKCIDAVSLGDELLWVAYAFIRFIFCLCIA